MTVQSIQENATSSCLITSSFNASDLTDAVKACREKLNGKPDLAVVFVSSDYRPHLKELIEILQIDGHTTKIIGASADGLYGVTTEHENASGVSMLFLKLPQTVIHPQNGSHNHAVHFPDRAIAKMDAPPAGWIILGNPLQTDLSSQLRELNSHFPTIPVIGGLVRGGPENDDLFLFTEDGICREDFLSVRFHGGLKIHPLISQGCRPIGDPLVVTGASHNQIISIGRKEALKVLEETFDTLPNHERRKAQGNVFAGLAATENVDNFETGHFVIRHIVGADLAEGRLMLDSPARVGQTLQFQIRESEGASQDLRSACQQSVDSGVDPFGAMIFGGHGRGRCLFEIENHDAGLFHELFGEVPLTGMFANGEIGPIAGRNFRHDHSFCAALFLNPDQDISPDSP